MLIRDDDESAYRREVEQLALWCGRNNLELNTLKTVEMTVDFPSPYSTALSWLRKYNLPQELLIQFYSAVIESVLCTSITVWFASATKLDKNRLQRTVRSAEKIIGANLPTIQDLYTSRVRKRAGKITADPSHKLFKLLPSGRRYRSLFAKTSRHKNSFFPLAVSLLNS